MVLRTHYWRIVLVAVLLNLLIGSDSIVSGIVQPLINEINADHNVLRREDSGVSLTLFDTETGSGSWNFIRQIFDGSYYGGMAFAGIVIVAVLVISLLAASFGILVELFIINPLYIGAMRFYSRSFDTKPQFKDLFYVFDNKYKNAVSVMFLRDLYTVLWCLLFIVPGIVKSYEYFMVPYLMAENPGMEAKEAFEISRQMMDGQKWKTFVLDLSFLGWKILSALTFGILGLFFVEAYYGLTGAALYRRLRGLDEIPQNVYYDGMEDDIEQGWYEQPK